MKSVYLDNAATTALRPEVVEKMTQVLNETYGNASSSHSFGRSSKALLEQCRKNIASYFKVSASEIVFTSGGTEADNLALRSSVRDLGVTEIITSKIEHHAVLHTAEQLQKEYGITISYVDLDASGLVNLAHLEQLLQSANKSLVSLMHINNEIGNILDLKKVANLCRMYKALFHSDMVQSVGHYIIDLKEIPIDFMAASAHKFHGPKGVGFCFIRKESGLKPLIFGGEQERGLRAGTEAIHNIVGMDEALKIAYANLEVEHAYILNLKTYFIAELKNTIPDVAFNGCSQSEELGIYTLLNVRLPMAPGKASMTQFQLDLKGIASSRGSACQSGSHKQSHVLNAILYDEQLVQPSIRFSFCIYNTKEELDYVVGILKQLVLPSSNF